MDGGMEENREGESKMGAREENREGQMKHKEGKRKGGRELASSGEFVRSLYQFGRCL